MSKPISTFQYFRQMDFRHFGFDKMRFDISVFDICILRLFKDCVKQRSNVSQTIFCSSARPRLSPIRADCMSISLSIVLKIKRYRPNYFLLSNFCEYGLCCSNHCSKRGRLSKLRTYKRQCYKLSYFCFTANLGAR